MKANLAGNVVRGVAHRRGGLQRIFELYGEDLQLITVVENLGDVKLGHIDHREGLLVHYELKTDFFKILGPATVFEVVDDGRQHGVRVPDPDERDLLEVWQVSQIRDVE